MKERVVKGFSKFEKRQKIDWLISNYLDGDENVIQELKSFWHSNAQVQKIIDGFTENTISNFPMPFDIAPNFLIDGEVYAIPMVIEESSVVAAASSAAKFWMSRGGFHTEIVSTTKVGQIHFLWNGTMEVLQKVQKALEEDIRRDITDLTENMEKRGGGLKKIELIDLSNKVPNVFQIRMHFETCNSMGANFINSILERSAKTLETFVIQNGTIPSDQKDIEILMSILSNYTPECIAKAWVEYPIEELGDFPGGMSAEALVKRFESAVLIAKEDPYRAVTHNKGIYNGIDSLVLATGNDFRAIEAAGHAYAARDGQYRSLSTCTTTDGIFRFELQVPLAIGTVGGLTKLHPLAKIALDILGNPSAEKLMRIVACIGLAQNFAALRSLVTTGIQAGHMKMHLLNILNSLQAQEVQIAKANEYFEGKVISYSSVSKFLKSLKITDEN